MTKGRILEGLLTLVIGAVIAGLIVQRCSTPTTAPVVENDKVLMVAQARFDSLQVSKDSLAADYRRDTISFIKKETVYQSTITSLKHRAAKAKEPVAELILSNPELDFFVGLQDSTIYVQDAHNDSLNAVIKDQWRSFNILLNNSDSTERTALLMVGRLQAKLDSARVSRDEWKKKARKKFSIGPYVGYGTKGPDIGVGVQWRWFRF